MILRCWHAVSVCPEMKEIHKQKALKKKQRDTNIKTASDWDRGRKRVWRRGRKRKTENNRFNLWTAQKIFLECAHTQIHTHTHTHIHNTNTPTLSQTYTHTHTHHYHHHSHPSTDLWPHAKNSSMSFDSLCHGDEHPLCLWRDDLSWRWPQVLKAILKGCVHALDKRGISKALSLPFLNTST